MTKEIKIVTKYTRISSHRPKVSRFPWVSVPVIYDTWAAVVQKEIWKFKDVLWFSLANFKQTVWQSDSVGALLRHLASLNTSPRGKSFTSLVVKQLSVHHFNCLEVLSCSSQRNGTLACSYNWQESTHHWLNCVPALSWRDMLLCVWEQWQKCLFNCGVCVCVFVCGEGPPQ